MFISVNLLTFPNTILMLVLLRYYRSSSFCCFLRFFLLLSPESSVKSPRTSHESTVPKSRQLVGYIARLSNSCSHIVKLRHYIAIRRLSGPIIKQLRNTYPEFFTNQLYFYYLLYVNKSHPHLFTLE